MPKNVKKRKKDTKHADVRPLLFRDGDEQFYAKITNILGGYRYDIDVYNSDHNRWMSTYTDVNYRGLLRGSLRKRTKMTLDKVMLVSKRDYQDNIFDIIHVYNDDENRQLLQYGHITEIDDDVKDHGGASVQIDFSEI